MNVQVAADQSVLTAAAKQRKSSLRQLLATARSDAAALRATRRAFIKAEKQARRQKHSLHQASSASSEWRALLAQSRLKMHQDNRTLFAKDHTDFTGVHAARHKLAADIRALREMSRRAAVSGPMPPRRGFQ
jgi:hypothetical protein